MNLTNAARDLRIGFAGTPEFARHFLAFLLSKGANILVAYSQPDRPAGRGKRATASPVKQLAIAHEIPVEQPLTFRQPEALEVLQGYKLDLLVVVAYGLILPEPVLTTPRLGCINIHASLLPRWRGAAPIQRAIEAGDHETGVTIMQMDKGLDTGDMLAINRCDIHPSDTAGELHDRLLSVGEIPLIETLNQLAAGTSQPDPQQGELANYAKKLDKTEARIDWQQTAGEIRKKILAFNPAPGAFTELDQLRVKVLRADSTPQTTTQTPGSIVETSDHAIAVACGEGVLNITELQLAGKKPMRVAEALRGNATRFALNQRFL